MFSSTVIDADLGHAKSTCVREDRDKAVKFAIDPDFPADISSEQLHAAIVVVQL